MKKIAISLAAVAVIATGAFAGPKEDAHQGPTGIGEGALDCTGATYLTCGDFAVGSIGAGGSVAAYGCTGLSYDLAEEAVYEICTGADGDLDVVSTYLHGTYNDLDLFVLGSCDPADCLGGSLGTDGFEQVVVNVPAGTYYAVVDGWNGLADGSDHDVSVSCAQACDVSPTIESSWGAVKSVYSN